MYELSMERIEQSTPSVEWIHERVMRNENWKAHIEIK